jgi:serine/threonine protein kinase
MSRVLQGFHEGKVCLIICQVLDYCSIFNNDLSLKTKTNVGPIRWMSPESLGQQIYSKKSDVWMFGIVGRAISSSFSNSIFLLSIKLLNNHFC